MTRFEELELHLRDLYLNNSSHAVDAFKPTFRTFFGEEHQTFRLKMLYNLDQLRLQFERENILEVNANTCLEVFRTQFKVFFYLKRGKFIRSSESMYLDILERLIDKTVIKRLTDQIVLKYGEFRMKDCKVKTIKETEKPLNEAIPHEHEIEKSFKVQSKDVQINPVQAGDSNMVATKRRGIESKNNSSENALSKSVNETQMQMQEGKVDMESSRTKSDEHNTSSRSGNDVDTNDAVIRPVNGQEPLVKVQLTAPHNVLTNEPHHTKQSKSMYDQYLLEKVDSNTTPNSTNMSHRGGEIDQNAKNCQVSCPLLDSSFDNMTTEFSNQSLESENIFLKKTITQLQKDFSRMEAHCVNMELKYQNQALKYGQHGQILNETSNKAKIKKEIEVLETINIELEHSVAKLLAENEKLHREIEHLKQTYKDLYDSIKKIRVQTKDHNDSLAAQINSKTVENADLKAQIQEKVFVNVALKNKLRKLKGNNVDTKFTKASILGKPVLQPPRNQSVVRKPNAFKSERPNFFKPRFASQVDMNNVLSKPITQHYFPKGRKSSFAKPNHMIASCKSRNSSKNMPRFSSNDMVHNHYLEEAQKDTRQNRNLKL
ncbi:hypothetical protein Tco_0138379 [Tanacetum coccineum]